MPNEPDRKGPRRVAILGSTGSIGRTALRVAAHLGGGRVRVSALAAGGARPELLAEQIVRTGCRWAAAARPEAAERVRSLLPDDREVTILSGPSGIEELVRAADVDLVLCAIVGIAGIHPVLAALERGCDVALASKEVLVSAGRIVMRSAREAGARILPVDSEHSALFQCLENRPREHVRRLILTASGGPFRTWSQEDMERVTPQQALAHPTWNMGPRVTIDSATLMNKGLEIIEACRLFEMPEDAVDVLIHPGSIVHGLVELADGGLLAHAAAPDMALPIQYAFTWPDRLPSPIAPLDLTTCGPLLFEPPDETRFPCLRLAREAVRAGGTVPAALNAADEVAVSAFLTGRIGFPEISRVVEEVVSRHVPASDDDLEAVLAADRRAREEAERIIGRR